MTLYNKKMKLKEILIFLGVFLVFFLLGSGIFAYVYVQRFANSAGLKPKQVVTEIKQGWQEPIDDQALSFLILGLDRRSGDNSLLTDTILIATLNRESGDLLLFSLPRDLYLTDLQTKINALYYYGSKINPQHPSFLIKNKLEEVLDTEIDHTVTLAMEDVKDLIDFLGGIEIKVENSFTDEKFPKDDGSGEVMTVSFEKGTQVFDGERALQFMRSRQSEDEEENHDLARQRRQKQVILALKSKIFNSPRLFTQPKKLGGLYKFMIERFNVQPEMDLKDLATLVKSGFRLINGKQIEAQFPWQEEDEARVLVDTYESDYNTWILVPKDDNWEIISDYYQQQLNKISK